ncbi:hypothetical protein MPL3356_340068 [Mesorhizobium plurifarium]|uniref:Uncharacterized protein n=1 Tax=Mesorhizobium plurifarium TaxID=69974 RepID=A0A090FPM0_MESPL|nr:hypothetical protein MPL3356_340068 [Mesorhizobium plurifarium]
MPAPLRHFRPAQIGLCLCPEVRKERVLLVTSKGMHRLKMVFAPCLVYTCIYRSLMIHAIPHNITLLLYLLLALLPAQKQFATLLDTIPDWTEGLDHEKSAQLLR